LQNFVNLNRAFLLSMIFSYFILWVLLPGILCAHYSCLYFEYYIIEGVQTLVAFFCFLVLSYTIRNLGVCSRFLTISAKLTAGESAFEFFVILVLAGFLILKNISISYEEVNSVSDGVNGFFISTIISNFSKFSLPLLGFVFVYSNVRSRKLVALVLLIFISLLFFDSGSRISLFLVPFYLLAWLILRRPKIRLRFLMLAFLGFSLALILVPSIFLRVERDRIGSQYDGRQVDFSTMSQAVYTKLASVEYAASLPDLNLDDYQKNNILIGSAAYLLPRALFPYKPAPYSASLEPADTLSRLVAESRGGDKYFHNVGLSPFLTTQYLLGDTSFFYPFFVAFFWLFLYCLMIFGSPLFIGFIFYIIGMPSLVSLVPSIDLMIYYFGDFILFSVLFIFMKFSRLVASCYVK